MSSDDAALDVATATASIGGLDEGDRLELPLRDVLAGRSFGTGKSGSGKSNSGGLIAERIAEAGYSFLVFDLEGEYHALKESFRIAHVGADEEADYQIGPEHAEAIASLALEDRVPVVVDLSGYLDNEVRDEVVLEITRHLFNKEKKLRRPFLLIVEEAHEFIPEVTQLPELGRMLIRVAKRGRKRGLGIMALSQRPANVKKDFITQADLLIWHRLSWKNDLDLASDDNLLGDLADDLPDLEDGEAFVMADYLDELGVVRVRFDRKETVDLGGTPELEGGDRPELKDVDESVLEGLEEVSAAADQRRDELERLREERDQLDDKVEDLEERVDQLRDLRTMVESVEGIGPSTETVSVELDGSSIEIPEVIQAEVLEIREEKEELAEELDDVVDERDRLAAEVERLETEVEDLEDELGEESELRQLRDDLRELVLDRYPSLLDAEDDDRVRELRERIDDREETIEDLEAELERVKTGRTPTTAPEGFDDLVEKLGTEAVDEAISKAMSRKTDNTGRDVVVKTLVALARVPDPPVHASEILGSVPVKAEETVSRILSALEAVELATSESGSHNRKLYAINEAGIDRWIQRHARDEEVDAIGDELIAGASRDS